MKRMRDAAALLAVAVLSGCGFASVTPFVDARTAEFDHALVGAWQDSSGMERARIDADADGYVLTYTENRGASGRFHAVLGRVGAFRVLDLLPIGAGAGANDVYRSLVLPVHGLVVIDRVDSVLAFRLVSPDSMRNRLLAMPAAVTHTLLDDGVLLTAPAADTRRFMAAELARGGVLGAPSLWRRSDHTTMRPEETELWTPVPPVVVPGRTDGAPPSDAIVLFDGTNLSEWVSAEDSTPARWIVASGAMTVNKTAGNIRSRRRFTNYQLHLEWRIPSGISGAGQLRGNSGVFLGAGPDGSYELQIVDSYRNATFANGQAASVYKQSSPLVNAMRPPGEWQTYDVVWTAPTFEGDGSLLTPAYVTVLHNGILVQDHFALLGGTTNSGRPEYRAHGAEPIMLQAHDDPSAPISFRNIWVRPLP